MLNESKKKVLELLVALAWADGRIAEEETEVLEAMLESFDADEEDASALRQWAAQPRTLEEVDTTSLSPSDAVLALSQAVFITFVDGVQTPEELDLLGALATKLEIPEAEAGVILEQSADRAKALLPMLNS